VGSLSPKHGASPFCGWRNGHQLWRVAANILNKQPRTNDMGWSSSLAVGRGANTPSPQKNKFVTKVIKEPRTWTDSLDKRPKRWNTDMLVEVGWGDVYWIGLTQDRNRWRALVNSVMNNIQ
jgi:hypothetical protein